MRMFIRLGLLVILTLRSLQGSPVKDVTEDDVKHPKHYPPMREGWYSDPALKREMKRGF